jgi:hypothetical protein
LRTVMFTDAASWSMVISESTSPSSQVAAVTLLTSVVPHVPCLMLHCQCLIAAS